MIRLEGVTKVYADGTRAVDDVSFNVPKGEICILVGPSGCGKTTTMKMLNRLIPITGGKIFIDEQDITKVNENELRRNIGYVIQEIGLFPHMTVQQNIETVPALKGWPKAKKEQRARALLELMSMDPDQYLHSYPNELSGGQRQRVGVARAMGADPEYMLMDEPFGAIDPITRERLQDEFLKIQAKFKKTIIFVTHDINEAIKMGDKIGLMKDGKLVQYASPATLLAEPANRFVRDFVGADRTLKQLRLIRVEAAPYVTKVAHCKVDDNAATIRTKMQNQGCPFMPVVDEARKVRGWITLNDLIDESLDGKRVQDVFDANCQTVTLDTPLHEALSYMLDRDSANLPVVDGAGQLQGMLTFDCIQKVVGSPYAGRADSDESQAVSP